MANNSTLAEIMANNPNLGITGAARKRVSDKIIKKTTSIAESLRPENLVTSVLGKTIGVRFAKSIGVSPDRIRKLAGLGPSMASSQQQQSSIKGAAGKLGETQPILEKIEKNTETTNSFLAQMLRFLSADNKRKDIEDNFAREKELEANRRLSPPVNSNNKPGFGRPANDNKQKGWLESILGSVGSTLLGLFALKKVGGLVWNGMKGILRKIGIAGLFRTAIGRTIGASLGLGLGGPLGFMVGLGIGFAIDYFVEWLMDDENKAWIQGKFKEMWTNIGDSLGKFGEWSTNIDKMLQKALDDFGTTISDYLRDSIASAKNFIDRKKEELTGSRVTSATERREDLRDMESVLNHMNQGNVAKNYKNPMDPFTNQEPGGIVNPKLNRIPPGASYNDNLGGASGSVATMGNSGMDELQPGQAAKRISAVNTSHLSDSQMRNYFKVLAEKESRNNPNAVNKYGYLGKYQMGAMALADEGYVRAGTKNNQLNDPRVWTGKDNIKSQEDFLKNLSVQERAMQSYTEKNFKQLQKLGAITSSSSKEHMAGMLAAAHLLGANGAASNINKTDAFGTSGKAYYAAFNNDTQTAQLDNNIIPEENRYIPPAEGRNKDDSGDIIESMRQNTGKGINSVFKGLDEAGKQINDFTRLTGNIPALAGMSNPMGMSDFLAEMETLYKNIKETVTNNSGGGNNVNIINNTSTGGGAAKDNSDFARKGINIDRADNRSIFGDGAQLAHLMSFRF